MFGKRTENQMRTEEKTKKSKYENIEEAKYTEIKSDGAKEKLKNNGE